MPRRPLRVFISATTQDLGDFRAAAANVLLTSDIHPRIQENLPPDERPLEEFFDATIRQCDAVVCIVGHVFGAAPRSKPERSYTQMEYDAARRLSKPILVFLTKDHFPIKAAAETLENVRSQENHRLALMEAHKCDSFDSVEQLETRVALAVPQIRLAVLQRQRRRRLQLAGVFLAAAFTAVLGLAAWKFLINDTPGSLVSPDEFVERRNRITDGLQELSAYVQGRPKSSARERYLRDRLGLVHEDAADLLTNVVAASDSAILADMEQTVREFRFIAGLAFEGYRTEGERRERRKPDLWTVQRWLQDLEETGLLRAPDLPDQVNAGMALEWAAFYEPMSNPVPRAGQVPVHSIAALSLRLPLVVATGFGEGHYRRRNTIQGIKRQVALSEAMVESLSAELEIVPLSLRDNWTQFQTVAVAKLKLQRDRLDIITGSVRLLDELRADFAKISQSILDNTRLSYSERRDLFAEIQKAESVIEEMRLLVSGEHVIAEAGDSERGRQMLFHVVGRKKVTEFCDALRLYGIQTSRRGVIDFSPLLVGMPDVRPEKSRKPPEGKKYIGLKSISEDLAGQ